MTKSTQSNQSSNPSVDLAAAPLFLYRVTLDWNVNNSEEGDYCDKVWARNPDHAVELVARDMADHEDSGCETEDEVADFVANAIASAGSYAAERIADTVQSDCRELLAGPTGELSPEAAADFAALSAILKKYGAE